MKNNQLIKLRKAVSMKQAYKMRTQGGYKRTKNNEKKKKRESILFNKRKQNKIKNCHSNKKKNHNRMVQNSEIQCLLKEICKILLLNNLKAKYRKGILI